MATRHTPHGYWLEEAGPVRPLPPLDGETGADVVVIGGGFTGLWTAWWIAESDPEARVVVLEAQTCGGGPSGRNGGFVNSMWFNLPAMSARFGAEAAIEVARSAREAVHGIGRWCDANGVDAWYRAAGYLQVSTTPAHDGAWDQFARAAGEHGEPDRCVPLDADQVRARCDSPLFRGGALYPDAATVQPARLALGLRDRLVDRGVAVHERSRVRAVHSSGTHVRVATESGHVIAGATVLALGAASPTVAPLSHHLTLTSSHIVITEPVPDVLEEIGWTGGECITDSRALLHYFRTTPDGRIAFGWGAGEVVPGGRVRGRAELDPAVVAEVERHLVRFFPQLDGRGIEHAWGGPIDVSPTHLPVIGSLAGDRVHYMFGYTGNGVGPSHFVGRVLASLALDRRDRWSRLPLVEPRPVRVPPEPLRYVGGTIVRRAVLRKERLEEQGQRADPLTLAIAGLPERIGIRIGR
ncbi:MAG TPA: FAD-binding oxidoreductase [Solirubrobacterales bacterium]|nr:FAD-binding oxidoreductase [Solirubrobacterales bacterium]